jgi:hypothetical protein
MSHSHGLARRFPQKPESKPMDPNGYQIRKVLNSGFCSNCTILRARALVTDANGSSMGIGSGVYLHHIVVSPIETKPNPDPWGSCAGVALPKLPPGVKLPNMNSFLIVQGVENFTTWYTTPDGAFNSGYQLSGSGPTSRQSLTGEFVNYNPKSQNVYLTMEYDYLPGIVGGDAFMSLLSVLG